MGVFFLFLVDIMVYVMLLFWSCIFSLFYGLVCLCGRVVMLGVLIDVEILFVVYFFDVVIIGWVKKII